MHGAFGQQRKRLTKPTTSIRLSAVQLRQVDELARRTSMKSRTELIEQAIDRYIDELKESKVVVLRDWTPTEAKAEVLRYLKDRPSGYVSDIIEALGMEPDPRFSRWTAYSRRAPLTELSEPGDSVVGENLVARGRKGSRVHLIAGRSAHRSQGVYVCGAPAKCRIDIAIRLH